MIPGRGQDYRIVRFHTKLIIFNEFEIEVISMNVSTTQFCTGSGNPDVKYVSFLTENVGIRSFLFQFHNCFLITGQVIAMCFLK